LPCNDDRVLCLQISTEFSAFVVKEISFLVIVLPKVLKVLSDRIERRSSGDVCGCLNNSKWHKLEYYSELGSGIVVFMSS
jgi:hypothetical protein